MTRSSASASSRAASSRDAPARTPSTGALRPWLRRVPWLAIAITLVVVVTAAFAVPAVRDAATLATVGEVSLVRPLSYVAIAPASDILDTITLLTVGQQIALVLWAIGVYVIIRVWRTRTRAARVLRELLSAVLFLVGIVMVYAIVAFVPRPMAALATTDPAVVIIDFHSHTEYSHDGRPGWSAEDVRNWHRAAGYDVGYITDHATYQGAQRGVGSNPSQAGEGTMLLQGLEAGFRGEHVNILGAGRLYQGMVTPDLHDIDERALSITRAVPTLMPVLIETLPGNLDRVPAAGANGPGVVAIEDVDGSPRGLTQTRRDRARIVHLADSLNLALVTGSDNHGYGHAAPGWTLAKIMTWRGMQTDSLASAIEQILRVGRRGGTRTVERRIAGAAPIELAFAGPVIAWRMFTTLAGDERAMWVLWTWVIVILARLVESARADRRGRPARA